VFCTRLVAAITWVLTCVFTSVLASGLTAGCGSDGAVHVRVILPESSALSPVASKLARLTLIAESEGVPAQSTTRDVPANPASGGAVSFGDVPVGAGVRLSLLGYAASGRLVGYGRAIAAVDVSGDAVRDVEIRLRKPFTYVTGGNRLHAFDTTVEAGQSFVGKLDIVTMPTAVATTPDGAEIVVVSGASLGLVATSNHQRTGGPAITLQSPARRLAVSPDGRWAATLHEGGISIVDLAALRRGTTAPVFVAVPRAGALALSPDKAWVLVDPSVPGPPPAYAEDCSKASQLVPVDLAAGAAGAAATLAGGARDLAVTADGASLYVAEPCQGAVVRVTANGATQVKVLTVPNATDVAVADEKVWAVGQDGPANAVHLVLVNAALYGRSPVRLDLPATQELAESKDLSESGQAAEVRLDADRLDAFSLSVLPDGRNVALLVHGSYHANEVIRQVDIFGIIYDETIVPRMDVEAYEYQLLDVTNGLATQRLRTSCRVDWEEGKAVLDDWECASAADQGSDAEDYVPGQASVLYGAQ